MYPRIDESARGWSSARAVICGSGAAAARDAAAKLNAKIRAMINDEMEYAGCTRSLRWKGAKRGHSRVVD